MIERKDDLPPVPRAAWELFIERANLDELHPEDERRFARFVVVTRHLDLNFAALLAEHLGLAGLDANDDAHTDHFALSRLLDMLYEFGQHMLDVE